MGSDRKWKFLVPISVAAATLLAGVTDARASMETTSDRLEQHAPRDASLGTRDDLILQPVTIAAPTELPQHRSHSSHSSHSSHRSHYSSR